MAEKKEAEGTLKERIQAERVAQNEAAQKAQDEFGELKKVLEDPAAFAKATGKK